MTKRRNLPMASCTRDSLRKPILSDRKKFEDRRDIEQERGYPPWGGGRLCLSPWLPRSNYTRQTTRMREGPPWRGHTNRLDQRRETRMNANNKIAYIGSDTSPIRALYSEIFSQFLAGAISFTAQLETSSDGSQQCLLSSLA